MNKNNFGFYKNVGVKGLQEFSDTGGFTSWADMEHAYPILRDTSSVLELGAGYGRCLEFLIKEGYQGKMYAVEQSEEFVAHLEETFSAEVEIIAGDFNEVKLPEAVDSVLWMWSGIIDFTEEEQQAMFNRLFGLLNRPGVLVVDAPRIGFKTFAQHDDAQHLHYESPYGDLKCYIPSRSDMDRMCKEAGFASVEQIDYDTSTERQRSLFAIHK